MSCVRLCAPVPQFIIVFAFSCYTDKMDTFIPYGLWCPMLSNHTITAYCTLQSVAVWNHAPTHPGRAVQCVHVCSIQQNALQCSTVFHWKMNSHAANEAMHAKASARKLIVQISANSNFVAANQLIYRFLIVFHNFVDPYTSHHLNLSDKNNELPFWFQKFVKYEHQHNSTTINSAMGMCELKLPLIYGNAVK